MNNPAQFSKPSLSLRRLFQVICARLCVRIDTLINAIVAVWWSPEKDDSIGGDTNLNGGSSGNSSSGSSANYCSRDGDEKLVYGLPRNPSSGYHVEYIANYILE